MRLSNWHIGVLVAGVVLWLLAGGCKKTNTLTSGGVLTFSTDTLKFDTVFTAAGSFTNAILIYNPQGEAVVVNAVHMKQGAASYFHLNVDGRVGAFTGSLTIAPHDSIYVFATVNIDPTIANTPFLITDSLVATMNGREFSVPVTAYGQNAHYIVSDSMSTDTNWLTDKPYVVIHNCVVAQGKTLNIPRGCRVYMHQDAQFIVYGTMTVGQTGNTGDSVVFQGDRLDRAYFGYLGYPGEWGGMWFVPRSTGNISNAVIKNCGGGPAYYYYSIIAAAIRADTAAHVNIDHSTVENSYSVGLLAYQGAITATNCNINTTGGQALAVSWGGTDSFTNCTFANYGTQQTSHANAGTVVILNWFYDGVHTHYNDTLNVVLRNCIVYGSLDSEIICDTSGSPPGVYARLLMDHCLLKMGNVREPFITFNSCLFNKDPMFKNTARGDFHLTDASPAANAGTDVAPYPGNDLEGKAYTKRMGCYQAD